MGFECCSMVGSIFFLRVKLSLFWNNKNRTLVVMRGTKALSMLLCPSSFGDIEISWQSLKTSVLKKNSTV